ncbi:MAG: PaaI family thioesterase [Bacteroidetes bacterium]|nr:PaaI family thioesterase [Bacteroidota bacterium]
MEFFLDGDKIVSEWMPGPDFQGFYQVIHGGIQATLADEIAGWVVQVICKSAGVTTDLKVKYIRPVLLQNGPLRLEAWIENREENRVTVRANIIDKHATLCTTAEVTYHLFDEITSREKFYYPGIEAFMP